MRSKLRWGLLAVVLCAPAARADCGDGGNACGTFCHPAGQVCCDGIGRPDLSCAAGTRCVDDHTCAEICAGGEQPCGTACYDPAKETCCQTYTCSSEHECGPNMTCTPKSKGCAIAGGAVGGVPLAWSALVVAGGWLSARRRRG